jgi:enoyl-CoA hydratase
MTVHIEKDGAITVIIHDRAAVRNAMDPDSADALHDAFLAFEADETAHVAVLWGAGGAFCAGWDLSYAESLQGKDDPIGDLRFPENGGPTPRGPLGPTRLELSKPTIAAVAGPAVAGGMELALWCDLRVMERDAYFGVYCRRWGIPLIDGGTVRLPRLVGQGRALDIILTGRKVPAEECAEIGLCERLVEPGQSREAAEALAHEIARFPQACMRADRRSAIAQHGLPVRAALKQEFNGGLDALSREGLGGAGRFTAGVGRHGDFSEV